MCVAEIVRAEFSVSSGRRHPVGVADARADAALKSAGTPCATSLAEEGTLPGEWGMVELPVGYAPALENQFDPSHAEWLHAKYDEEGQLSDKANAGRGMDEIQRARGHDE